MGKWVCEKCYSVIECNPVTALPSCCNQDRCEFDLFVHGPHLISSSNSWIDLAHRAPWEKSPTYQRIADEAHRDGCYDASIILCDFIEAMVNKERER